MPIGLVLQTFVSPLGALCVRFQDKGEYTLWLVGRGSWDFQRLFTGLATLEGVQYPHQLALELEYCGKRSLWSDFCLILRALGETQK